MRFFTNGALFANLLPQYPAIKADLGLSNTQYGFAVAAFPAGALLAGLTAAMLVRRFRSSRVAVTGTIITGVGVLGAGLAGTWVALAAALLVAGAADAVTDVAQNAQGLRVQRRYGRSILNSLHAVWSIGAVTGGLMGALAVDLGLPRGVHLGISAVVFSTAALFAYRFLLPGHDGERREAQTSTGSAAPVQGRAMWMWTLGAVIEDAGLSWSALYLTSLGAPLSLAAFGFIALTGAQFVGRITGDRMVDRFGQRMVARAGGVLTAVGMGAALAFPSVPGMICGFGAAGFGVATLIPAAMHGADSLPGLRPGTGLAVVAWFMRVGFLLSPPIIGLISDATSLHAALFVIPVAGVAAAVFAQVLDTIRRPA